MSLFSPIQQSVTTPTRIHIEDLEAVNKFAAAFSENILKKELNPDQSRVIVCIGTDRSTGDSLGPIVGSRLQEINHQYFKILGTLQDPVHAGNLTEYLKIVDELANPFVIAIDACLGNIDNVGYINIGEGAIKPGAGVNKLLPPVGDLHITGVVNVGGFMEYFVLQNTRLNVVMKMSKIISEGINRGSRLAAASREPPAWRQK